MWAIEERVCLVKRLYRSVFPTGFFETHMYFFRFFSFLVPPPSVAATHFSRLAVRGERGSDGGWGQLQLIYAGAGLGNLSHRESKKGGERGEGRKGRGKSCCAFGSDQMGGRGDSAAKTNQITHFSTRNLFFLFQKGRVTFAYGISAI